MKMFFLLMDQALINFLKAFLMSILSLFSSESEEDEVFGSGAHISWN